MRSITELDVHCTATLPDFMPGRTSAERVAEVRRWHVDLNGWRDIGYHFLIDRDGTEIEGRPVEMTGAHIAGRNSTTIGISLFGGHGSSETDQFSDHFTPAQDSALRALIARLRKRFGNVPVRGHNEFAAKACPGFRVSEWMAQESLEDVKPPAAETEPVETVDPVEALRDAAERLLSLAAAIEDEQ